MTEHDHAMRERIATLGAGILRINASLDLDTVLREVVETACSLTGARLGVIATVDETGALGESFFSGFTPKEQSEVTAWPDHARLFEHLRELPGPLRLADLAGYVRSLGFAPPRAFSRSFQGTPMRHGGTDVGQFFLADKADGKAFDDDDEEALVLLAAQAATAIANARAHRAERRARAHLEVLVETTPVGVVVLDARNGQVTSLNREARRIMERLGGGDPKELLETVSFRRADGREVSLSEFPIVEHLGSGETLQAEEVVVSMPDGPSVRMLINATPIRAEDGSVLSVVIVFQDLAPLDEIERMRTEFLALVGHELRQPLTSIKGSADTLLEENLDPAEMREFHRIIAEQAGQMRGLVGDLLDTGRIETGTLLVAPEPSDMAGLVEVARNAFITGGGRHTVRVDLPAGLPPVMADRRRAAQVLDNLFANAARHAPESTPIRVSAAREDGFIAVSVADEGRGISPELLPRVFSKHTTGLVGSGLGLGLAICKGLVEAHGGRIRADSAGSGRGATFTFTLPTATKTGEAAALQAADTPCDAGRGARILVVDDDPHTLRFVRDALSGAGYAPLVTGSAEDLAQILRAEKPRLVLLDLILPGADGIELMQVVPELSDVPIIFISGYGRDETVVRALDAGAADYIVKPFSPNELVARVRAALRRREEPEPFVLGDMTIDYARRRVILAGETVKLTATEFDLLRALSFRAGQVVTHETLLRQIWGDSKEAEANLVRVFVRNLRRKLGDDAANPKYIFNERGVGYYMREPGQP